MKHYGEAIAKEMSKKTNKQVTFIECCDKGFHFQITQYKTIATTDINGNFTPSQITNKWIAPSEYIYSVVTCFFHQYENGDLEYFINNGFTQDLEFSSHH